MNEMDPDDPRDLDDFVDYPVIDEPEDEIYPVREEIELLSEMIPRDLSLENLPFPYLEQTGNIDYIKVGKVMIKRNDLQKKLDKRECEEYGNSRTSRWFKERNNRGKTELKRKIEGLEGKLNVFEKKCVPGNLVMVFDCYISEASRFEIGYTIPRQSGNQRIIILNSYDNEREEIVRDLKPEKIVTILSPQEEQLTEVEMRKMGEKWYQYYFEIEVSPLLVQDEKGIIFGNLYSVDRKEFKIIDCRPYTFADLNQGKVIVKKLLPVLAKKEEAGTYRT